MRLNRWIMLGGRRFDIGLAVTNIFNEHLVNRVDRVTGEGRVWGAGEYDQTLFPDVNDYIRESEVDDPSNYGPGRQIRLTLDYDF
jgi:hypothetical protein